MNSELKYGRILSAVMGAVWAIMPTKLEAIKDILLFRAAGGMLSEDEIRDRIGAVAKPQQRQMGAIAVLPLFGTISKRMGMLTESSGGTSVERFTQQFREVMASSEIGGVLIQVDSPGGAVDGVPELADEIYRSRGIKPIIALGDGLAASAAFWLATAADEFYITPSGQAGSVGVLCAHRDLSKAQEAEGVKTTLITSAPYKAEANPYAPLSEEAREYIQSMVSAYHGMFVSALARQRGVSTDYVQEHFGQGRVLMAKEAVKRKMADGVMTFDQAVAHMLKRMKQIGPMPGRKAMTIDDALAAGLNPIIVAPDGVIGPSEATADYVQIDGEAINSAATTMTDASGNDERVEFQPIELTEAQKEMLEAREAQLAQLAQVGDLDLRRRRLGLAGR